MNERQEEEFRQCVELACSNLNHPVYVSGLQRDRVWPSMQSLFIDVHTCSMVTFDDREISCCKDYRQIRNLVKTRLIVAIRDLRDLANESLVKLGDQEVKHELSRGT